MSYDAKTDWKYNDPVTEDDFNRIEQGIKDAHEMVENQTNDLTAHKNNDTRHITQQERNKWNNKVSQDDFDEAVNDITSQLTQIAQQQYETVTVGDSADFSTINEALEYLSKRHARFWKEGYTAEILLKSGFVMQEQVITKDVDLGWITISSEDTEVIINRASLTRDWFYPNNYPAFAAQGARLPRINVLFKMDNTGLADGRDGIVLAEQASVIISSEKGIKNAGRIGLSVGRMSFAVAHSAVISGSNDTNVYVAGSGMLLAENADLKNAGNYCIRIEGGSSASVGSADGRGGVNYGLYVARGSIVHANNINARRGLNDSNTDIVVAQGGIINAINSTGGTYITPNTLTANGIIFK